MTSHLKSSKLWLSPDADPLWAEYGHIQAAGVILQRTFKGCGIEAYQKMFDLGYIRVDRDGSRLYFNFGGNLPNATQLAWLQKVALAECCILINGDSNKEVDLESSEYREVAEEGHLPTN